MGMKVTKKISYGLNQPLISGVPEPIISNRMPSSKDKLEAGTIWIYNDKSFGLAFSDTYVLTGYQGGSPKWILLSGETFIADPVASPTDSVEFADSVARGSATYTGFTTAAGAVQVLVIESDLIAEGAPMLITACNLGNNDAQMTITRVKTLDGSAEVTLTNNGAAALNGDIILSFDLMF